VNLFIIRTIESLPPTQSEQKTEGDSSFEYF
jgi:hypothetical protein